MQGKKQLEQVCQTLIKRRDALRNALKGDLSLLRGYAVSRREMLLISHWIRFYKMKSVLNLLKLKS